MSLRKYIVCTFDRYELVSAKERIVTPHIWLIVNFFIPKKYCAWT